MILSLLYIVVAICFPILKWMWTGMPTDFVLRVMQGHPCKTCYRMTKGLRDPCVCDKVRLVA